MDPNITAWLSQGQDREDYARPRLERTVYRGQTDRVWPRLTSATRHQLAALFLAMGHRLSDERSTADIDPLVRTP